MFNAGEEHHQRNSPAACLMDQASGARWKYEVIYVTDTGLAFFWILSFT